MDTERIISQDGYRLEDLKPDDQQRIRDMRLIEESIAGFEYDDYDSDESMPTIHNMIEEIAAKVKSQLVEHVHATINDVQISIADSYEE